jgi:ribosomal protein L23
LDANKAQVKAAVEAEFKDIEVRDVRLAITKGKMKAFRRGKRARPGQAKRKDHKKAFVTLSKGAIAIEAFKAEEPEKAAAAAKTTEKKEVVTKTEKAAETKKAGLLSRRRTGRRGDK